MKKKLGPGPHYGKIDPIREMKEQSKPTSYNDYRNLAKFPRKAISRKSRKKKIDFVKFFKEFNLEN